MNDMDMLFDCAEFEKTTASAFAIMAADCGSEQLRQKLLQNIKTPYNSTNVNSHN